MGRALAGRLATLGHEVVVGTRDPAATLARTEPAGRGTNPLVFTADGPAPSVANTDSLAETLQRAFPDARVVKALNTMNSAVMVDPARVPGAHVVFVAGDDPAAKATVSGLLGELGWGAGRVLDVGALVAARGVETFVLLWWSMTQALGTFELDVGVHRA